MGVGRSAIFAALGFSSILVVSGVANGQTRPCSACASTLVLNEAQWHCVAEQLELYVGMSYDPVLITTEGCGPLRTRSEQPDISVRSVSGGRSEAPAIIQLSQSQIRCLRDHLPEIEGRSAGQTLDLEGLCGPAQLGPGR